MTKRSYLNSKPPKVDNPNTNVRRNHHQDNSNELNMGNGDEDEDAYEEIPQVCCRQHRDPTKDDRRCNNTF
ncbi:conserved hypothetical protein [Ricinus communis]|uniref:Uncharacterized protein n=1 Tax=Ricinus communis TaxID=3988 RepID=B9RKW6_RICCO|nr:conserved hypothetical protein [Ricinus communis]